MSDSPADAARRDRPLYPPARVAALHAALGELFADDVAMAQACRQGLDALLPDSLATAPAEEVLKGDRGAARRLRAELGLRRRGSACCQGEAAPVRPSGGDRLPAPSRRALGSRARAAVVAFGTDPGAGLAALAALRRHACRLGTVDRLHELAVGVGEGREELRPLVERTLTRRGDDGTVRPRSPEDFDAWCDEPGFPPDLWDPETELPEDLPSNVWDEPWFRDAYEFWRDFTRFQQEHGWTLRNVGAEIVCPGDEVELEAESVGDEPGLVVFPGRRPDERIPIEPSRWEPLDDGEPGRVRIAAPVPSGAGCGHLGLRFAEDPPTGPGGAPALGDNLAAYFDGALPWLRNLAPRFGGRVVRPGERVTMTWDLCPSDCTVTVELRHDVPLPVPPEVQDGPFPPPSVQRYQLTVPDDVTSTSEMLFEVRCHNGCGPAGPIGERASIPLTVHEPATVWLDGVEITQGVQFFRADDHLPEGLRRPDNSVPLVHRKPTLVRVYFRCDQRDDFNGGEVEGVRVRLFASSDDGELETRVIEPHVPGALVALNDGSVATQRGSLERSANFVLPDEWTWSDRSYRYRAVLELEEGSLDRVDPERREAVVEGVRYHRVFDPDVRVVRYRYKGPGDELNVFPTRAEAHRSVRNVRRGLPVRDLRLRVPESHELVLFDPLVSESDLTEPAGWGALLRDLVWVAQHYVDSSPCIWNGVLSPDLPRAAAALDTGGLAALGITWPGETDFEIPLIDLVDWCAYTAFVADRLETAIHEYGHVNRKGHPGGGGVSNTWLYEYPEYDLPDYGHAMGLDCGEYGVDVEAYVRDPGSDPVKDPAKFQDVMVLSGSRQRWPSPYFYVSLANRYLAHAEALRGHFGIRPPFDAAPPSPRELLVVAGRVWLRSGRVELRPVHHRRALPRRPVGGDTDLTLELLDDDGEVLHAEPLRSLVPHPGRVDFHATPPLRDGVRTLVLRRGDRVLHERKRAEPPKLEPPVLHRGKDAWKVSWPKARGGGDRPLYHVSMSRDDGRSWFPLTEWSEETGALLDPDAVAGGERCRLRVYATTGFATAFADSEVFELPVPAPDVRILAPQDAGEPLRAGAVLLEGEAWIEGVGDVPDDDLLWVSDVQGELGRGRLLVAHLAGGGHRLSLQVDHGGAKKPAQARVRVLVKGRGGAPGKDAGAGAEG